jgi:hypothetical protein
MHHLPRKGLVPCPPARVIAANHVTLDFLVRRQDHTSLASGLYVKRQSIPHFQGGLDKSEKLGERSRQSH